ncbi:MAG: hypothetical protein AAF990_05785 [Bacteroidota bacterium]
MKHLCVAILLCLFLQPTRATAQDKDSSLPTMQMGVKLYTQFLRLGAPSIPYFDRTDFSLMDYLSFSPSFTFQMPGKPFLHEIEPTFRFRDYEADGLKETYISLRYEIGKLSNIPQGKKMSFRMGLSSEFFFYNGEAVPGSVFVLRKELNKYGILASSIPHLHIPVSDRFYLDLNMALLTFSFHYQSDYTDNPAFTEQQKTLRSTAFEFALARSFRVGFGLIL